MRWLIALTIVVAGLGYYFGPFEFDAPEAQAESVLLRRPGETEGASSEAEERASGVLERPPAASADARPAPEAGALGQARARWESGDRQGAVAVLRDALGTVRAPLARGRLALELSGMVEAPAERRQLLGVALRSGAVRDAAYDTVGAQLRALNRQPKPSLLDLAPCEDYEVRAGDSLWKLCTQTLPADPGVNLESGLLQMLNGMSSSSLRLGQTLRIPRTEVEVVIDRQGHGLVAWLGDLPLIAYQVGLGKESRTPSGDFTIEVKQKEPDWYTEGRVIAFGEDGNILGTRWMGFENQPGVMGYGIHGTAHPESIGLDESMGCVRMRNEDVEELFELLPRGTIIRIP